MTDLSHAPANKLSDVKAVLFDFDGTLAHLNIDFAAMTRRVRVLMRESGLNHRVLRERYVLEQIQEAAVYLGDAWEDFRKHAMIALREVEMEAAMRGKLLPGVPTALKAIHDKGIKIAVLTRNCREAVLAVAPELETYCDAFVPRDDAPQVKPHPGHLRICLGSLNVDSRRSLMVGDHVIDIHSGQALGMRTVGVLTGNTSQEAFEEAGADLILEHVTQLADLLRGRAI
jgi:phosphoglycolate phosphatase